MNARKLFASSAAALAVVASVGIAYAQSTTEPVGSGSAAATPAGRVDGTMNANTSPSTAPATAAAPADTSAPAPVDTSTSSDLPAQADRG